MNDDLNTAIALSVIFDLVRLGNKLLEKDQTSKTTLNTVDQLFRQLGGDVLGIVKESYASNTTTANEHDRLEKLVENLLTERNKARQERNFAVADKIRDALTQADITITDAADGTSSWSLK
jgi:cysteinyl-tRNA synthetase